MEENNAKYTFDLNTYLTFADQIKQKDVEIFKNIVGGSRLGALVKFSGYGALEFNDNLRKNVTITENDKYLRGKINCVCYDVLDSPWTSFNGPKKYDKLFVYCSAASKNNGFFHYCLYNSKTGLLLHKANLIFGNDYAVQHIYESLTMALCKQPIYKFYSDKYDGVKKGTRMPKITEYKEVIQRFNDLEV